MRPFPPAAASRGPDRDLPPNLRRPNRTIANASLDGAASEARDHDLPPNLRRPNRTIANASLKARGATLPASLQGSATQFAYYSLLLFMVVYWARPEDWVPGLSGLPVAKVAGVLAVLAFALTLGSLPGRSGLPAEIICLGLLGLELVVAGALSPVWRSGAILAALDFSKGILIIVVIAFTVRTLAALRRLVFVQVGCVTMIAAATLASRHFNQLGRLVGVGNGMYANSNDLALALSLALPFCLFFLLRSRNPLKKAVWCAAIVAMVCDVVLTASRAGTIATLVGGGLCLWHFGVKGKRPVLVGAAGVLALAIAMIAGARLKERFAATFSSEPGSKAALAASG